MKHSKDRILTTHTGSLARPLDLIELMLKKEQSEDYDPKVFAQLVSSAVSDVVERQINAGIDVICDGEQGKPSFLTYVKERLSGFETDVTDRGEDPWRGSREVIAFPEYYEWAAGTRAGIVSPRSATICTGPIRYIGHEQL